MEKPVMIPHFVIAPNKQELMRLMLKINLESSAFHKFFDIQKDGNSWVAWYYKEVKI
jgi:hypothetical protein